MGTLRIVVDDEIREVPLAGSELLGRSWHATVPIASTSVPAHWLELRYRRGDWCWRPLAAHDRTRGTGSTDAGGWRRWTGRGSVRLEGTGETIELALVDADPPATMVENCRSRRRWAGADARRFIEAWPDGRLWPLGAEIESSVPLQDGDIFIVRGDPFRVMRPAEQHTTDDVGPTLANPDFHVSIRLEPLTFVATCGSTWEASVTAECARVAFVYAQARIRGGPDSDGGWLDASGAYHAWLEIGGRSKSPPERIGWERGKLRSRLAEHGLNGLEGLFETRRYDGRSEVRIGLTPDKLELECLPKETGE